MLYDLSNAEKKIARAAIDKGLDAEFKEGMENFEIIIKDWQQGKFANNKEAYHKLFKAVNKKDDAISKRYDGLTGARWMITVAAILHDGYITAADINGIRDETREMIYKRISLWNAH